MEVKGWDGRVLFVSKKKSVRRAVEEAVASGADLTRADLAGAYLTGADLTGANLTRADLTRADLTGAYLTGADLTGADLTGANLTGATGINPLLTSPLHMLVDQVGKIRAYKLVDAKGRSPMQSSGKLTYRKGETVETEANADPNLQCGAGINVASLDWCLREWRSGWRVLVVEFTAKDIAAIPTGTDGKFRVTRCKVVGEKSPAELGLA